MSVNVAMEEQQGEACTKQFFVWTKQEVEVLEILYL